MTIKRIIIFVAFTAILACSAFPVQAKCLHPCAQSAACEERQILVSGSAEIFVEPDRVRLAFGITEKSRDLKAASDNMGMVLGKALSFLRSSGIQDKHIQTSHVSIRPEYHFDSETRETILQSYALSQSFAVTLEDTAKYEEIFRGLLGLGINEVRDVTFSISGQQKYRNEALAAAVKAAEKKARILADAAGVTLGKAMIIQEGRQDQTLPRMRNVMLAASAMDAAGGHAGEGFALGTIAVQADVTVVFKVE
jgi:hypothetical protein